MQLIELPQISNQFTPAETAKVLLAHFNNTELAVDCVLLIRSQIPMYTGNLNPKWEYWTDVVRALMPDMKIYFHEALSNSFQNKS